MSGGSLLAAYRSRAAKPVVQSAARPRERSNLQLYVRLVVVCVVLFAGVGAQTLLRGHVQTAASIPPASLTSPLAGLPMQLGDWTGADRPIDTSWLYGDDHLHRVYRHGVRGQTVMLWMAYSKEGADRGHHPEVCMAVAGQPEDTTGRQTVEAAGHEAAIQQYRFGRVANYQLVYYWHYTMFSPERSSLDWIQQAYHRMRHRPASLTIEVFAPESSQGDADSARDFVLLVDAALQEHVGAHAVRGSTRLPVTLIDG